MYFPTFLPYLDWDFLRMGGLGGIQSDTRKLKRVPNQGNNNNFLRNYQKKLRPKFLMTSALLVKPWQISKKISKMCNFLIKNHIMIFHTILESI